MSKSGRHARESTCPDVERGLGIGSSEEMVGEPPHVKNVGWVASRKQVMQSSARRNPASTFYNKIM
jgi:hypothetical protein